MADRQFYGGTPPTGAAGGEIGAGRYDGPEAHIEAPWKCPACGVQNEAPLKFGCVHCGSGQPGKHVGQPPASPPPPQTVHDTREGSPIYVAACAWAEQRPLASAVDGFLAGYALAWQLASAHTVQAAPVTADVSHLAPEGKPRRTIIAALEIFRDQVLTQAEAEIASGEWCSVAEVDALIDQLMEESLNEP